HDRGGAGRGTGRDAGARSRLKPAARTPRDGGAAQGSDAPPRRLSLAAAEPGAWLPARLADLRRDLVRRRRHGDRLQLVLQARAAARRAGRDLTLLAERP